MSVIKDAGKSFAPAAVTTRRARLIQTAKQLRSAQTDEEAADALEAALELAKEE